ncbi:MAG: replication endonuclease [Pseudomonadales bacterium]|nr:replication endonuclease [Pseudomonadales bacterium]
MFPEDRRWSEARLPAFGPLETEIRQVYQKLYEAGFFEANTYLRRAHETLCSAPTVVRRCRDDDDIDMAAKETAKKCLHHQTVDQLISACKRMGLPVPGHTESEQGWVIKSNVTSDGALARSRDWHHWRRELRKLVGRHRDQLMRHLGFVHKQKQIYCSDEALRFQQHRQKSNKALLESLLAVSDSGDELTLADIQAASLANPALRRAELLARIRGFERWADEHGDQALFVTQTAPSKYHSRYADSGRSVAQYNGADPRDVQKNFNKKWARMRAKFKRESLNVYGIRIVEPHHDGCPHWHLLLFIPDGLEALQRVQQIMREEALAEDPPKKQDEEKRIKFEVIDRTKGTATAYLIKYVSKSIDGHGMENDLHGISASKAAQRIVAWARTWGIRQFQSIGGPSVTVWREYRRLRSEPMAPHNEVWVMADAGDWCGFMHQMGGAVPGRLGQAAKLIRGMRMSYLTGECSSPVNQWGERLVGSALPITGIVREGVELETRRKFWKVVSIESLITGSAFQQITVCAREAAASPDAEGSGAWTRVNNCTREKKQIEKNEYPSHLNEGNSGSQEPKTGPPRKMVYEEELDDPSRLHPLNAEVQRCHALNNLSPDEP